ncbi:MAG: peptidoglycan-associated lipoprotein [Halioglobus sp.]|jgi:peptidoglycan-associated lipoprotein
MKQLPIAGKVLTLLFTAVFLVACSSNDTKEMEDTSTDSAQQMAEDARLAAERAAAAAANADIQELQDAVTSVGNVFYFEYDSATLTAPARMALDAHIALLGANDRSVRLEGHTDERGTREYNLALGERRANAVRDYMAGSGISSQRVESVSYGEEQPIAYGSGESNWTQNRRVELK